MGFVFVYGSLVLRDFFSLVMARFCIDGCLSVVGPLSPFGSLYKFGSLEQDVFWSSRHLSRSPFMGIFSLEALARLTLLVFLRPLARLNQVWFSSLHPWPASFFWFAFNKVARSPFMVSIISVDALLRDDPLVCLGSLILDGRFLPIGSLSTYG